RRKSDSSGGRNRTYEGLVQSQVSLPTATPPEFASGGSWAMTQGGIMSGWPDSNRRSPAPHAGGFGQPFLHSGKSGRTSRRSTNVADGGLARRLLTRQLLFL